ncbi:MAG: 7-cyano-7-deazaguanine reductase [Psychrobacter glaciei]|jgi:7-cyano-7-deazaguanine reductase
MHEDTLLGKQAEYKSEYDPSLIFPISRAQNREKLTMPENKVNNELPFFGIDIWTGFEISWLNQKGKPQVFIAEFLIPAESKNIVESKSFKLYLNSFNQTKFDTKDQAHSAMVKDLSKGFAAGITIKLFDVMDYPLNQANLGDNIDHLDVDINDYKPNASLLAVSDKIVEETLNSHLLKSNCPVTNQPDWGTVVIDYKGTEVDRAALLKYIISYRDHDDFHEHCAEQIFCDLCNAGKFELLTVSARYTRRGGLDINPTRSLKPITNKVLIGRLSRQ